MSVELGSVNPHTPNIQRGSLTRVNLAIIMVATDLPGFSVSPIHTVGGIRTNLAFHRLVMRHPAFVR